MADGITSKTRILVSERAGYICEYCRTPSAFSTTQFSIEHIIPKSSGGNDDLDNLAFSCQGCNNIKFTKIDALDAESNQIVSLFNPRIDKWVEHFCWDTEMIKVIGLTPVGRATVDAIKLNREEVCNLRAILFLIGEHPPSIGTP